MISSLIFGATMFAYGRLGNSLTGIYMGETEEERIKRRAAFFASEEELQQRKDNVKLYKEYQRDPLAASENK